MKKILLALAIALALVIFLITVTKNSGQKIINLSVKDLGPLWAYAGNDRAYACLVTDTIHADIIWKITGEDGEELARGTDYTSLQPQYTITEGVVGGPLYFQLDIGDYDGVATAWFSPTWYLGISNCVNVDTGKFVEKVSGPCKDETDSEGFCLFGIVQTKIYMPLIMKEYKSEH